MFDKHNLRMRMKFSLIQAISFACVCIVCLRNLFLDTNKKQTKYEVKRNVHSHTAMWMCPCDGKESIRSAGKCLQFYKKHFDGGKKSFVRKLSVGFFHFLSMTSNHPVPIIWDSIQSIYFRRCLQIEEMFLSSPVKSFSMSFCRSEVKLTRDTKKKNMRCCCESVRKVFKLKNFFFLDEKLPNYCEQMIATENTTIWWCCYFSPWVCLCNQSSQ